MADRIETWCDKSASWAVARACNLITMEGEPGLSHVGHNEFQARVRLCLKNTRTKTVLKSHKNTSDSAFVVISINTPDSHSIMKWFYDIQLP